MDRRQRGPRLVAAILCLAALAFDVSAVAAHAALLETSRAAAPSLSVAPAEHGHQGPVHDAANCPVCRDRVQPRAGLLPFPTVAPSAPLPALDVSRPASRVLIATGVRRILGARAPPTLS
ncbi:MAG: hypothetical protein KC466_02305 [Myxococcales bacterium]|nr:hypothetical protein [Myxococcales bacterium]